MTKEILIFFALILLDVIPLPNIGLEVRDKIKSKNLWSIILLGMAAGLVVGPCTAPILGTLLLYVTSQQNILHGVTLLFVFSYGVGASLILLGTFSGFMSRLPQSGIWMIRIKQVCGIVLIGVAEYFLIKAGMLIL